MIKIDKYKIALILALLALIFCIAYTITVKKELEEYKIYNSNLTTMLDDNGIGNFKKDFFDCVSGRFNTISINDIKLINSKKDAIESIKACITEVAVSYK